MTTGLFDLTGRSALVTGSSRGLGLVIARGLARAGASVVLNGRSADTVEAAVSSLREEGLAASAAVFDVCDEAAVAAAVASLDRIDVLVNNAGIQQRAPLHEWALADWQRMLETNITAAFLVARAVVPQMLSRGEGKIINIASLMSDVARPGIAPYATTKGAIKQLTQGMCADWAPHGLNINAIGPGYFATELNSALVEDPEFDAWLRARTPSGRWGDPEELVGAAVFLSSAAASFVNGQVLYVDGGVRAVI